MRRVAICILFCNALAFAEQPPGIGDYFQRFREAAKRHAGARYPGENRVNFRLGMSPYLHTRDLGHTWWFAEWVPDAICLKSPRNACSEPVIAFDTKTWLTAGDAYREMLVFHELGHCVLNLDHDPAEMVAGKQHFALSVMHPGPGPAWDTYIVNRELYHEKLFARLKGVVEKITGVKHERGDSSRRFNLARSVRRHLAGNGVALKVVRRNGEWK